MKQGKDRVSNAGKSKNDTLNIFDIQRASYHDGPGIRTVIFLKGCSLACKWCQNPESLSMEREILFYRQKCIGCGKCAASCPLGCHIMSDGIRILKRDKCNGCGICAEACNAKALELVGKQVSVERLAEIVLADKEFYELSGGGVTLSGGEPLLQYEACAGLLRTLKERGIHTAIETAGNVPFKAFKAVLPYTDCILYDIKIYDEQEHEKYCGAHNRRILENFRQLAEKQVELFVRIPVIPGINDKREAIASIAKVLKEAPNLKGVKLLPFHTLAKSKYKALGKTYWAESIQSPSKEKMKELGRLLTDAGLPVEE